MAHKKPGVILITAFIMLTFITTGCKQSYAPASLGTPTVVGTSQFPEAVPTSMEEMLTFGAQTATAQAATGMATVSTTPGTPEAVGTTTPATPTGGVNITPEINVTSSPATSAAAATTQAPTSTSTLPVLATTAAPTSGTSNHPTSYTLQKGEYPYCIARRFNVNPDELLNLNSLTSDQGTIYQPGFTLQIPQTGNPFPSPRAWHAHPTTYTVTDVSQTVNGVACYFGDIDPSAIIQANNLTAPYTLYSGQVLTIP